MTTRPVLLTVEDDPAVSRAVARDLRRRYGESHRVVRAENGPAARIVQGRHRGTLSFATGPGGTTFTVRLPLAERTGEPG